MNWVDIVILLIIGGMAVWGMKDGFIQSAFKILSFIIALILAMTLYSPVSAALQGNEGLYNAIHEPVKQSIMEKLDAEKTKAKNQAKKEIADDLMSGLPLPSPVKTLAAGDAVDAVGSLFSLDALANALSDTVTKNVINLISIVVVFILVKVGLFFIRFLLEGIADMPVFKEVNAIGGLAFGAVEGVLLVFVLCAFLSLFFAAGQFKELYASIDSSFLGHWFYENNWFIRMLTGFMGGK